MKREITSSGCKYALIYCRVSSEKQKTEGHGLDAQEHRCREYCRFKGYKVDGVFLDTYSGGGDFLKRPAMKEMLEYIDRFPHRDFVLIVDDLKRFARDVVQHWKLRELLKKLGVSIESPNFEFNEDNEQSWLNETMTATFNEYERRTNRKQVIQKMKARLEKGYWTFNYVPGYEMVKDPIHGKILKPKYPEARYIKEALEGFASGRFKTQAEISRFLKSKGFFKKKNTYYHSATNRMLRRVEYAGYVEFPAWEVSRRKGNHEALISLETFNRIQERLSGKVMLKYREDIDEDFPLRGFVLCDGCGKELTASWSKGRKSRYPYYHCVRVGCPLKYQSISRKDLEDSVKAIFKNITPKPELLDYVKSRLLDKWQSVQHDADSARRNVENSIIKIRSRIQGLVDMIDTNKPRAVVEAYEKQIEELSRMELLERDKLARISDQKINFGTALDAILEVLANPYDYWERGDLTRRRLLLQMVFSEKLAYSREKGLGTATLQLPVKVFQQLSTTNSQDVVLF